ncbi:MAG: isopentenyl-diphosphate Delta-isomerase [Bacteroidetes bacterium]|nr:isopentenyl-diphosphate Delta-isomerase [Bacteroidota bacterium]
MEKEQVILVNEFDVETGTSEKLNAHLSGQLHRALSVFIFNSDKKMLLQRRAISKYHSGGLWSNACCSHPRPGEDILAAAVRRLTEELGIKHCELHYGFNFIYKANLDNHIIEHELDHVFFGKSDEHPKPNPEEVSEYKYLSLEELYSELFHHPQNYTFWFKLIFERVVNSDFFKKLNQV